MLIFQLFQNVNFNVLLKEPRYSHKSETVIILRYIPVVIEQSFKFNKNFIFLEQLFFEILTQFQAYFLKKIQKF